MCARRVASNVVVVIARRGTRTSIGVSFLPFRPSRLDVSVVRATTTRTTTTMVMNDDTETERPTMTTRNPREARAMGAPKTIVSGIETCARAYVDESARRRRLGEAYARAKRASASTPSVRCAMTLVAQLVEACDGRREIIARVCGRLGRRGRMCASTLEAFAECNEWTAVELSGATTVDGQPCDVAAAIGATKRALARVEREESRKLRRILEGRMLEPDTESPPRNAGTTAVAPQENARVEEEALTRIRAPDDDCIIIDDAEDNDDDDDYDDELVIPTTTRELEESPTPTIMTQPVSDDDSGDDAKLLRNSLTSPRTKNVAEILMEMDLPRRERFQSISVTPSPEDDAPPS